VAGIRDSVTKGELSISPRPASRQIRVEASGSLAMPKLPLPSTNTPALTSKGGGTSENSNLLESVMTQLSKASSSDGNKKATVSSEKKDESLGLADAPLDEPPTAPSLGKDSETKNNGSGAVLNRIWKKTKQAVQPSTDTPAPPSSKPEEISSLEDVEKELWQERIEKVNTDALGSPSFVETTKRKQVLPGIDMEKKAGAGTIKAFFSSGTKGRNNAMQANNGGPKSDVPPVSTTSQQETKDGTKNDEPGKISSKETKPNSSRFWRQGQQNTRHDKQTTTKTTSSTRGRGVASMVEKFERKPKAAQEQDATSTDLAANPVVPSTATADSIAMMKEAGTDTTTVVASALALLFAVLVGLLLLLAPSSSVGDWICGPAFPMRKLGSLSAGAKSITGEAPWFAPSSMKQEAFARVCGPKRTRTIFEWGEQSPQKYTLEVVDAATSKRLFSQKKIIQSTFYQDRIEYSSDKNMNVWDAPWQLAN